MALSPMFRDTPSEGVRRVVVDDDEPTIGLGVASTRAFSADGRRAVADEAVLRAAVVCGCKRWRGAAS